MYARWKNIVLTFIATWMLLLFHNTSGQAIGDYRSKGTAGGVAWETAANWERWNGSAWITPAPAAPSSTDGVITILTGHKMIMTANRTLDQVVIAAGGTVTMDMPFLGTARTYTINDGVGIDIEVNGNLTITSGSILTGTGSIQINSGGVCDYNANSILNAVTFINNGTFNLNDGALTLNNNASFTNNGLMTFFIILLSNTNITASAGTGILTNSSTGTMYRNGSLLTGAVVVSSNITFNNSGIIKGFGEFQFASAPVTNAGSIEPGNSSSASLTVTSNAVINKSPTFNLEISGNGTLAGTDYDQVVFSTTGANVTGATLKLVDNSTSTTQTPYVLLRTTSGTLAGFFSNVILPSNFANPVYTGTTITVQRMPERHWIATTPQNWSNTAYWSATAGGAGGASVPTNANAVFFDNGRNGNCILTTATSASSIVVDAGYSGAIVQGTNSLTVVNNFTMAGGTFTGGTLAVTIGGSLSFSGTLFTSTLGTLSIGGNLTVNGPFDASTGMIVFNGSALQSVTGSQVVSFNNVTNSNTSSSGVVLQSDQNLKGVLTLSANAVFDADGTANNRKFTMLSVADSPVQDASIATLPATATFSGNVTAQRFMSLEGVNSSLYRYISSPIAGATVADMQNEIPVTGSFTGSSNCSGCSSNPSLFYYDESVIVDNNGDMVNTFDDGYIGFPSVSNTEAFQAARGYTLYVRGNLLSSAMWDLTGPINQGNFSFPVSYTSSGVASNDGWNLVGNPYPSTIDWNASPGWVKTNITTSIYIRDNGAATPRFASWNGVTSVNGGSRYIAMGQAFWVKASASPTLSATEAVKTAGQSTTFFRQQSINNLLKITLSRDNDRDEAVIHFREDATPHFDDEGDAFKLGSRSFDISTLSDDQQKLSINSWSPLGESNLIKMAIDRINAGTYEIDFSGVDSFESTRISMVDLFLKDTVELSMDRSYRFSVTSDDQSKRSDRFHLLFGRISVVTSVEEKPVEFVAYPNPSSGKFEVIIPSHIIVKSAEVLSSVGTKIMDIRFKNDENRQDGLIDLDSYPSGIYIARISFDDHVKTIKLIKK